MRIVPLLKSPFGTVLRYAFTLILVGWLVTLVEWDNFGGLRALDWSLAWFAVVLAGMGYLCQAWRWQVLLAALGVTPPVRWVHQAFWVAQFYNSFLPGGVAGDAVRFGYLWRVAPKSKAAGAASLLADRLLGLVTLCLLAVLALGFHLGQNEGGRELYTILMISVAATGLLLVIGWLATQTRGWEPLSARLLGVERATALHDTALVLGKKHAALVGATVLSVVTWLLDFASLWLLARSVGLEISPLLMSAAAAAAYLAAALPVSIGGHGLREGTLVTVLGWLGLQSTNQAVPLLAAAFLAISIGWSLFGGLVYVSSLLTGSLSPARLDAEPR